MKAQQAPSAGDDILSQHCCRESAVEMEFIKAHSKKGGILFHKKNTASKVRAVFIGEENKFFLDHPIIPDVLIGGGKSGCSPGKNFCITFSFTIKLFLTFN